MVRHYVDFGFPDTSVGPLVGFPLTGRSPADGKVVAIKIDSPSEFMSIACFINEVQVLPQQGHLSIRQALSFYIGWKVKMKDRLVVDLENHDPINLHTPTIIWEIEGE